MLAIETSAARGSVALLDDDRLIAERQFTEGSRHGRELLPCVDELLGGASSGVELVAVSAGPGSYTGLRVGITFAKMFAVQAGVPVATVSSLDVIAENVRDRGAPLCVVVDARLGEVYAALYDAGGRKAFGDIAAPPAEVAAHLSRETWVVGDGLRRHRAVFEQVAHIVDDESAWVPRAVNVGRLGRRKYEEKGGEAPHSLEPRYLRRPQAELKWESSQNEPGRK